MDNSEDLELTSGTKRMAPPLTLEGQESRMVSAAMDLAYKQIMEGTASSQVITHFLKIGSVREQMERERLEEENKLLRAKTKALEEQADRKELYAAAIKAFQVYSGGGTNADIDD